MTGKHAPRLAGGVHPNGPRANLRKQERDPAGEQLVLSYMRLRKVVGYIGAGLPFALAAGRLLLPEATPAWPRSMSGYYWTGIGNVFVGALSAIGVFLFSYRGYDWRDKIAGRLACIFAIGVAIFPVCPDTGYTEMQQSLGRLHLASAALLFGTLSYFSLFLFTLTNPAKPMTPEKRKRNHVYRVCGWTMVVCLVLIAVCETLALRKEAPFALSSLQDLRPVFFLEALMVLAFGVSWLTKGEAILADRN